MQGVMASGTEAHADKILRLGEKKGRERVNAHVQIRSDRGYRSSTALGASMGCSPAGGRRAARGEEAGGRVAGGGGGATAAAGHGGAGRRRRAASAAAAGGRGRWRRVGRRRSEPVGPRRAGRAGAGRRSGAPGGDVARPYWLRAAAGFFSGGALGFVCDFVSGGDALI